MGLQDLFKTALSKNIKDPYLKKLVDEHNQYNYPDEDLFKLDEPVTADTAEASNTTFDPQTNVKESLDTWEPKLAERNAQYTSEDIKKYLMNGLGNLPSSESPLVQSTPITKEQLNNYLFGQHENLQSLTGDTTRPDTDYVSVPGVEFPPQMPTPEDEAKIISDNVEKKIQEEDDAKRKDVISISNEIAKIERDKAKNDIDYNNMRKASMELMSGASKNKSDIELLANMLRAGMIGSSTMAGLKADTSLSDALGKQAAQLTDEADAKTKHVLDIAKEKRESIESEARLQEQRVRLKEMLAAKRDTASDKSEEKVGKYLFEYSKLFNSAKEKRSGALANAAATIRAGESLQALLAGKTELTDLETKELAATADRMLRGGGTAVATLNALLPKDVKAKKQKIIDWLTSEPSRVERKELIKLLWGMVERERPVAEASIKDYNANIAKMAPDDVYSHPLFQASLKSEGIDEQVAKLRSGDKVESLVKQTLKKIGTKDKKQLYNEYKPDGKEDIEDAGEVDPKIQAFADKHYNGDYGKAERIINYRRAQMGSKF